MDETLYSFLLDHPHKFSSTGNLVTANHLKCALEGLSSTHRLVRQLICNRQLPEESLPDASIMLLLSQLASLDTNNFAKHIGCGEREGRVFSSIVRQRYFNMTHGVGRSGEVDAHQPKALGSSLMYPLTNYATLSVMRDLGFSNKKCLEEALVVPLSTGMCLSLVLQALANKRRRAFYEQISRGEIKKENGLEFYPQYVVCCRIDQKTCLKCIAAAGLTPVVVHLRAAVVKSRESGISEKNTMETTYCVQSHVDDVHSCINSLPGGASSVVSVLTTTSCFIPRLPDPLLPIGRLCREYDIPHVVNNAYGLQSKVMCKMINTLAEQTTASAARLDAVVQSTDKNFMTPVGGAVVLGSKDIVREISKLYPGRASAASLTDLFITLLSMGRKTYIRLAHEERYELFDYFKQELQKFALARNEELVSHPLNDISLGMTLRHVLRSNVSFTKGNNIEHFNNYNKVTTTKEDIEKDTRALSPQPSSDQYTRMCDAAITVGAKLYHMGVTGPRVIVPWNAVQPERTAKMVAGLEFKSYGMHGADEIRKAKGKENQGIAIAKEGQRKGNGEDQVGKLEEIPTPPMLVVAGAIGMCRREVNEFFERLGQLYPVRCV